MTTLRFSSDPFYAERVLDFFALADDADRSFRALSSAPLNKEQRADAGKVLVAAVREVADRQLLPDAFSFIIDSSSQALKAESESMV